MELTEGQILSGLRQLELTGKHVIVHSSLSSLGYVKGGADSVISALEGVITEQGTLFMATYSGELILFLETLALRSGEHPYVFSGHIRSLWKKLRSISLDWGIEYPFDSCQEMAVRLQGETKHLENNCGWEVEDLESDHEPGRVVLRRKGPGPEAEEVKPWKMPVSTGRIPETFWRRPETYRSHQYSGSFTGWGKLAEKILKDHDNRPGQGLEDHPLYRLMKAGGKVLLLGVDHRSNSMIHVAQWAAYHNYRGSLPSNWREFLDDFTEVESPLNSQGGQILSDLGRARVRLADSRMLFKTVAKILDQKASHDLLGNP